MPELPNFLAFLIATLILLVIPGPAVLFVVGKSIDQGKMSGIISVLGIAFGTVFHVVAAAFGISALLTTSELAFNILKYVGASYLIYLGLVNIYSKKKVVTLKHRSQNLIEVFFQGVLVNILNPKTALFIFSFIPQFVSIGSYPIETQIFTMGMCFIVMGIVCDSSYVIMANAIKHLVLRHTKFQEIQKKVSGSIYLFFGLITLTLQPNKIK